MSAAGPSDLPQHQPDHQRFVLSEGQHQAVLDYRLEPDAVVFTHTFVPPELRGGGRAGRLVAAGLDWAEGEGLEVRTECSYVAAVLARKAGSHSKA